MNADFEYRHSSADPDPGEPLQSPSGSQVPDHSAATAISSERFELLSAYLDGEVSPEQRKQVELWLDHDPVVQHLYTQLLHLRESIKSLPIPEFEASDAEMLAHRVFNRVDRHPRVLALWAGAGAVVAATCVAAISGLVMGNRSFLPQTASHNPPLPQSIAFSPAPTPAGTLPDQVDSLMIGLEQPVMDIPKATMVQWNHNSN